MEEVDRSMTSARVGSRDPFDRLEPGATLALALRGLQGAATQRAATRPLAPAP